MNPRPLTQRELFISMARLLLRSKLVIPGDPAKAHFVNKDFPYSDQFKNADGSRMFKSPADVFASAAEAGRSLKIPVGSISKLLFGVITLVKIEEAEAALCDIASAVCDEENESFNQKIRIEAERASVLFFGAPKAVQPLKVAQETEPFDKLTNQQRRLMRYLDEQENKRSSVRDAMKNAKKSHASKRERKSFLEAIRRLNERLAKYYPNLQIDLDRNEDTITLVEKPAAK